MRASGSAPPLRVLPVDGAEPREAFVRLPWRLYRDDPAWVPPLLRDLRRRIDPRRHPFHEHSDVQLFLAVRDGRPAGRIAAIHNRNHVAYHGEPVGFFGFFECEDDPAAARALVGAAAEWVRSRELTTLRGPTSFSTNEEAGLLVEGHDRPPAVLMPHNPPYYERLLLEAGFSEAKTLAAYWVEAEEPPEYLTRAGELVRRRFPGIGVRRLRMEEFDREVERVRAIYNAAWADNWGFVPMTDAELRHLADELKPVVDPDLVLFAETEEGEPVGFSLALPDVNVALRHADGRLFPFGLLKILWHSRRIRQVRVVALGVLDEWRGKGIDALLYLETFERGTAKGYTAGEFSWVLEDNERMKRPLLRMGASVHKRYRLYDLPL